jgi:hypothetical protein
MKKWCNRCNRYHDSEPVDPQKIIDEHANELARQIDIAALHMSDKGYEVAPLEKAPRFDQHYDMDKVFHNVLKKRRVDK